jgi:hypothetical protein
MTVGFKAQKTQLSTTLAQMEYRLARYALNGIRKLITRCRPNTVIITPS